MYYIHTYVYTYIHVILVHAYTTVVTCDSIEEYISKSSAEYMHINYMVLFHAFTNR